MLPTAPLSAQKKSGTILVVAETLINIQTLICALQQNYYVLTAESGEAALNLAAENLPDLILLDLMAPRMDGFSTAEALSIDPRLCQIPIIFLTDLPDNESEIRGLKIGATDFLIKPINLTTFHHRISNVIKREQLRTEAIKYQKILQEELIKQTEIINTFESIFNASNEALVVTTQHFIVLRMNDNANRLFACSPNSLYGTSLRLYVLKDIEQRDISFEDCFNTESPRECKLQTSEGGVIDITVTARILNSANGEKIYLFCMQNISQWLKANEKKRKTKEFLQDVILELTKQKAEALDQHSLVSVTDAKGIIAYANDKFCITFGYSLNELIGQTHSIIKSGEHQQRFYAEIWKTISSGNTWHGEIANRAKDGHIYWAAATIIPWLDEDGIPYQYVAIFTDISDRIRAEQQLAIARQRELEIGASIQHRLLFGPHPPNLIGFAVGCYTEASQGIDGDFYTFTHLGSSIFEILTGDVMGKGVNAALIAAGVKSAYRKVFSELMAAQQTVTSPSPATVINALHAIITPELVRLGSFVTLSLLRFDRQTQTVTWVNAGHTPTLLVRNNSGEETIQLTSNNLPLGVMESEYYEEYFTHMEINDTILLYSDGISESINKESEQYGEERIKNILKLCQKIQASPSIILNSLRSDLQDFTRYTTACCDDRTAIVVQLRPVRGKIRGSILDRRAPEYLDIPRQLDKIKILRQRIAALAADQTEESVQMLTLAAFEAAANIISHTPEKLKNSPITAMLKRDNKSLFVELIYAGEPFLPPKNLPIPDFSGNTEGGFGLFIIQNSVDQIEYCAPLPGMASVCLMKNFSFSVATN